MWDWLTENAATVEALATVGLLLIATAAAWIALAQVNEARRLRREQAQPYVVAGMRSNPTSPMIMEIFLRNYGNTAAFDVRVEADPPLTSQWDAEHTELVILFDALPTMAPGEEWATLWDSATTRWESSQPLRSTLTVSFVDTFGKKHVAEYVLDWDAHKHRQYVVKKGMHELATAAAKLSDSVGRVVADGALVTQDKAKRREELSAHRRAREAQRQAAIAAQDASISRGAPPTEQTDLS
jgi:hypothetical protein